MRKWQTYGVSNITLHTIAMVLNTSVVFSMGKFLFCWAKAKKYLFLSYFLKMSLTTDFKYFCLPPTQILLCHHLMSLAWVWHQHKIEISDWPAHYSPRFLPLPTWTDTKNIFNGVKPGEHRFFFLNSFSELITVNEFLMKMINRRP